MKESPNWEFFEVDKYMCPILNNHINLAIDQLISLHFVVMGGSFKIIFNNI